MGAEAVNAACTEGPGAMVRAGGHTWNIPYMFVTLDVSQLEMSSLKASKPSNRPAMSVIDETVQPEIGPYVLRAVARSSFHIWTAVSRAALVTRDGGGGDNGGGDGGEGGGAGETQPEA